MVVRGLLIVACVSVLVFVGCDGKDDSPADAGGGQEVGAGGVAALPEADAKILARVRQVMADEFELELDAVEGDKTLADLGGNEVWAIAAFLAVESEYDIEVSDERLVEVVGSAEAAKLCGGVTIEMLAALVTEACAAK